MTADSPSASLGLGSGARLQAMASAVGGEIGHEFLECVVAALRDAMRADVVFITLGEGSPAERARTVFALDEGKPEQFEYDLKDVPCKLVYDGETVIIPADLAKRFPKEEGYEGYVGVPVRDIDGNVVGHFAAMSTEPIVAPDAAECLVKIFGARVEADLRHRALLAEREALIEDLVGTNETLRDRSQALHNANLFKTQLMGMIAHDLRSPLAALVASVDLLDMRLNSSAFDMDRARRDVSKIISGAERLSQLIAATLERCRADSKKIEIQPRRINLSKLVRVAVETNRRDAERKSIQVTPPAAKPVWVTVDEGLCLEAIDNLISNAIKYSQSHTRVNLRIFETNSDVCLAVSDEGQGLSEIDIARAFHPFQTLSAQPTAGESATGLGLSNVRQVAEAHGGSVAVESEGIGEGATFYFRVPTTAYEAPPAILEGGTQS